MIAKNRRWLTVAIVIAVTCVVFGCEETPVETIRTVPDIPVPTNLSARLGEDIVKLSWQFDSAFSYSGFVVYRSEDDQLNWVEMETLTAPPYIDSNLRTGYTYWYAVAGVDGKSTTGKRSQPFPVRPAVFALIVNNGAEVTSFRDVTLTFTAPIMTQNVRFSEDSTLADAQWRDFAGAFSYKMSDGDGTKVIYAQFRDEAGNLTDAVSSSIELDTFSEISALSFTTQTGTDTIPPGHTVSFRIETTGNETGGLVQVFIEGIGSTPVDIFDDGRNGDTVAGDGIYERDFTFELRFRQRSMRMSAGFVDAAENASVELEFEKNLYMSDPPENVELYAITQSDATSITLHWEKSVDDHFEKYLIYRDTGQGIDPTSSILAGTVADPTTTVYTDSDLPSGSTFWYAIYVVNDLDEGAKSNEEQGSTTP